MEESDIIIFRKLLEDASEVKKPRPNIAGIVLIPKMNMTKAPSNGFAVLAAAIAKK